MEVASRSVSRDVVTCLASRSRCNGSCRSRFVSPASLLLAPRAQTHLTFSFCFPQFPRHIAVALAPRRHYCNIERLSRGVEALRITTNRVVSAAANGGSLSYKQKDGYESAEGSPTNAIASKQNANRHPATRVSVRRRGPWMTQLPCRGGIGASESRHRESLDGREGSTQTVESSCDVMADASCQVTLPHALSRGEEGGGREAKREGGSTPPRSRKETL